MSLLISASKVHKSMGARTLFESLSFGISEGDRLGLLGPNGAGKSTLLKILAGVEPADSGDISHARGLKRAFVQQQDTFQTLGSVESVATEALIALGLDPLEAQVQASIYLSIAGFEDFSEKLSSLSGGWRKRLSLAIALAQEPDLLIMDEPTNHMDWDGILWLESWLKSYRKAFILVSHDREFLDRLCNRTLEIHALYKDGYLDCKGGYRQFLKAKEKYIQSQISMQESMSNKARRETEWLRAGVKARTTKSQSRIKEAHQLLDDLGGVKSRNRASNSKVAIEIDSAGKKSKKFIELKKVSVFYDDHYLVNELDLMLGPKTCIGLLGPNGCGKSSLLKVLAQTATNFSGSLFHADDLEIIYFDQKRESLPQDINLIDFLGDGSDYTVFKGQSIHVAGYASRFLFTSDKMQLKISQLSGGEQARLLIAKLMLRPADVLILDEPTNDLDIDSIEILEESLANFAGLVIVVSHDRYFLSQVCHRFLGYDQPGEWKFYSDLNQWLSKADKEEDKSTSVSDIVGKPGGKRKSKYKLSYNDKRQLETIESDIASAEEALDLAQKALDGSEDYGDHLKMKALSANVADCQARVDSFYTLWEELETKVKRAQS